MASHPLLLFPSPEKASKTPGHGFGGNVRRPSPQRQWERLSPIFEQLQESFNARCVELQQTATGIDPEQVLVIKTIGGIQDFANAVKRIPGLEWMGEIELDEIIPDEDFYEEKNPKKDLSGRLFLVMTNQQALKQMLSLWKRYQVDTEMRFERGLTKFRDVFLHLKELRQWGIEDRLAEREVFEIWEEDLKFKEKVRFEAELWYRKDETKRSASERVVSELIQRSGGTIKSQCTIPSIAYHSILGEIPAQAAQQIIEHPEVDLLQCDSIMFFRPTGQMATGQQPAAVDLVDCAVAEQDLPAGDPTVAVLDGLPLENHTLLADRLIVDDPDEWASEYPALDRQHGTAMTSLIVHGDLNNISSSLNRPVYVRPIMKPNPTDFHSSPREECIPDDILFIDYIHRAVKRIMEGEGDDEAAAPTVKIINLSIGDQCRHFSQLISPLARLLDWLSVKYNILFIVSAGNHRDPINTDIPSDDFDKLTVPELEKLIVTKIYEDARHRRLFSPGENINGLTVGASHYDDTAGIKTNRLLDVFSTLLPSPVSAFGSGYRRGIKPDFLYHGGKLLFSSFYHPTNAQLSIPNISSPRGNATATPSSQAGELNKQKYSCGTSNSTALTTRAAAICYDTLAELFSEQLPKENFSTFGVQLLKAMLVHGCSWDEIGSNLERILCTDENGKQIKNWISRWIGYGIPDFEKISGCTDQRATLLGFGQLGDEEAHVYKLPLPPSLSAQREWRKFTVTLAWLAPIAPTTQKYRAAQLWFDFGTRETLKEKLWVTGIDTDGRTTKRGTVQHEIFEGEKAVAITDGDILQIKVNCRKDASKFENPIAYGLVVSLEVAEDIDIQIYNEIRTRIALAVEIRA